MESTQQSQIQTQCGAPQAHGPHWWEEGNHTDSCPGNQQSQKPYGGVGEPITRPPTWGDQMTVTRRVRIEPALIPQVSATRQGDVHGVHVDEYITGELLHERLGRGNLHNWDMSTGQRLTNLHPFAGANVKPPHGVTQYLKLDAPRRTDTQFID